MAIVNNTLSEIGDSIIIKSKNPLIGITGFLSFVDDTENETVNRFFIKSFRFSTDSLNYGGWIELTNENLEQISLDYTDITDFDFKYERGGTDETGVLVFNSVSITGNLSDQVIEPSSFNQNEISEFVKYDSGVSLYWALNVADKTKNGDSIYKYIKKAGKDFSDFWITIARLWGMLVAYARALSSVFDNKKVIQKFISSRGVYFNNNNTLQELSYLVENIFLEYKKRGTFSIFAKKEENENNIDGEFLRLIEYSPEEDFFYNYIYRPKTNWFIDVFSPTYRGRSGFLSLNRSYENTESIEQFDKYPVFQVQEQVEEDGNNYIRVEGSVFSDDPNILEKLIPIESYLDYELSFKVRISQLQDILCFGVYFYNEDFEKIEGFNAQNENLSTEFFKNFELNVLDQDVTIRTIIFAANRKAPYGTIPNIGTGNNLIFPPKAKYIVPIIWLDNTSAFEEPFFLFRDLKIHPLSVSYDMAFLNPPDTLELFLHNNSRQYNLNQLESILTNELLPYNLKSKINIIPRPEKVPIDVEIENAYNAYLEYIAAQGGIYDTNSLTCLFNYFDNIYRSGLIDDASLIFRPFAWKLNLLFLIKGNNFDFTRNSFATRTEFGGLLETMSNHIPRFSYFYNNKLRSCPALLVESSAINLLTENVNFVNWGASTNLLLSDSGIASHVAGYNWALITAATGTYSSTQGLKSTGALVLDNTKWYFTTLYLKKGTNRYVAIRTGGANYTDVIDFDAAAIIRTGGNAGNKVESSLIDQGSYLEYRTTSRNTTTYAPAQLSIVIDPMVTIDPANGLINAETFAGSETVLALGGNFEVDRRTSLIITGASATTRNAEFITKTGISDKIGQVEGYMVADFVIQNTDTSIIRNILAISDGTTNNRITIRRSSDHRIQLFIANSGVTKASIFTDTNQFGRFKAVISYGVDNVFMYVNGVFVGIDISATIPTCSNLYVGKVENSTENNFLNDHIIDFEIGKNKITQDEALELSSFNTFEELADALNYI